MNKIDKIFKDGLRAHASVPSAEAWGKLNGQLNQVRRKKGITWLSIAASVTLIATAVVYFNINIVPENQSQISETLPNVILEEKIDNKPTIKKEQYLKLQSKPTAHNKEVQENLSDSTENSINNLNTIKTTANINNEKVDKILIIKTQESAVPIDVTEMNAVNKEESTKASTISETLLAANRKQQEFTQSSSVKIVYNLQPVIKIDSSVLKEKSTPIDSKSGVLGKIVAFAKNAKASDVSLGQLRAAKDDFLNFDNLKKSKEAQK